MQGSKRVTTKVSELLIAAQQPSQFEFVAHDQVLVLLWPLPTLNAEPSIPLRSAVIKYPTPSCSCRGPRCHRLAGKESSSTTTDGRRIWCLASLLGECNLILVAPRTFSFFALARCSLGCETEHSHCCLRRLLFSPS